MSKFKTGFIGGWSKLVTSKIYNIRLVCSEASFDEIITSVNLDVDKFANVTIIDTAINTALLAMKVDVNSNKYIGLVTLFLALMGGLLG